MVLRAGYSSEVRSYVTLLLKKQRATALKQFYTALPKGKRFETRNEHVLLGVIHGRHFVSREHTAILLVLRRVVYLAATGFTTETTRHFYIAYATDSESAATQILTTRKTTRGILSQRCVASRTLCVSLTPTQSSGANNRWNSRRVDATTCSTTSSEHWTKSTCAVNHRLIQPTRSRFSIWRLRRRRPRGVNPLCSNIYESTSASIYYCWF